MILLQLIIVYLKYTLVKFENNNFYQMEWKTYPVCKKCSYSAGSESFAESSQSLRLELVGFFVFWILTNCILTLKLCIQFLSGRVKWHRILLKIWLLGNLPKRGWGMVGAQDWKTLATVGERVRVGQRAWLVQGWGMLWARLGHTKGLRKAKGLEHDWA